MNASSDEKTLLRGYLLASLPEPERLELAARYFADDELFERLSSAEADLIDDYVAGELSPEERRLFEETLQTFPGRAERLSFARALQKLPPEAAEVSESGKETVSRRRLAPSMWWALAAALAVAAIGAVWVARRSAGYEDELRRLRSERDRLEREHRELTAELAEMRRRIAAVTVRPTPGGPFPLERTITFLLTAGLPRDAAGGNRLRVPETAAIVRLELPIEGEPAARYRVRIERADGSEVLRREGLRPTRTAPDPAVLLEVGAGTLPQGDFVALLEDASGDPVEEYFFRVVR